jgi:hypothetical protein
VDYLFSDDDDYGYWQFYDSIDTVILVRRTYGQTKEFTINILIRIKRIMYFAKSH